MSSIGSDEGQSQTGYEQNSGNVKPLQMANLGTKKEPLSSTGIGSIDNTPEGIRTPDLRIRKMSLQFISAYLVVPYNGFFGTMQENSRWVVGQ